jgi:hypothetical protein
MSLFVKMNGKTRLEDDPEARIPSRREICSAAREERGAPIINGLRMKYGIPASRGAGIFLGKGTHNG